MDVQLDQAPKHHTAISSSLQKNYLVHSVHDTVKTLASFLAFLTNVADWHLEKPDALAEADNNNSKHQNISVQQSSSKFKWLS